jgi:AcrR family transcriptional regulator
MLTRLVALVRADGLPADPSLRQFAERLGTSHRMLAYYFGSREGLLANVLSALRAEEREWLLSTAREWSVRDAALAMWSLYTDPARRPEHQAFFYVFSRALQQPELYGDFLASFDSWVGLTAQLALDEGEDPQSAQLRAQLIVSSIRGLLIDRLVSSEPERIDKAFGELLDVLIPECRPTVSSGQRQRVRR